ncbi:hypothetical protein [Thalassobellus suaedae]|uniref:Uncharacterized protein n=1 Tax=Thalassobellus suaedae TaxID=3074124 RepID=A0ABY9XW13_9FLAO|nr:hypothetical protein RHP51_04690 [Flavobacteriaceae bacterium HL-DH14]
MLLNTNNEVTNLVFNVEFWMYSYKSDDYDNHYEAITAIDEQEAINKMKQKYRRGKSFKVCK